MNQNKQNNSVSPSAKSAEQEEREANHSLFESYIKEVIYGGIDGIITTFAVVSGFSGASLASDTTTQLSFFIVLLFGLANLFADATSMGLGNFLSVRSDQAMYRAKRLVTRGRIRKNQLWGQKETIEIMMAKGFTEANARQLTDIYQTNEEHWVDFMMLHKLELTDSRSENPIYTGLATFLSFLLFGAIPLLPFIIFAGSTSVGFLFELSIFSTLAALIALGLLKWKIIGTKLLPSLFEVIVVGGAASIIAFAVGSFFSI